MRKFLIKLLCALIPFRDKRRRLRDSLLYTFKKPNIISYWADIWGNYLVKEDIRQRIEALKKGMDQTSCEFVDKTIELYEKYIIPENNSKNPDYKDVWCSHDLLKRDEFKNFSKSEMKELKRKYKKSDDFDSYLFFNKFGLCEDQFFSQISIKGKSVLDLGAYNGDTACMFMENFDIKDVHAYEPSDANYEKLSEFVSVNNLEERIIPVKKGIADKITKLQMVNPDSQGATFNVLNEKSVPHGNSIDITTIDHEVKEKDLRVGIIKFDIEGFEKKGILGGLQTIREQKPILLISIYHNPVDFFEIKPLLESLDMGYRFAVRRSETVIPLGDIVLIAY